MRSPRHHPLTRLTLAGLAAAVASAAAAQDLPKLDVPPVIPVRPVQPPTGTGPLQGSLDTPDAQAGCAPAQTFKATVRNVSPGLAAADRAAQPRQIWRLGDKYLRSEQAPDLARGDLTVIVIAEPDIWTFNLATREGRHAIDPGPALTVKAPILPPAPGLPGPLQSLEFGCEAVFVARHAPQQQRVAPWGSTEAALHAVTMGEHQVAILMDTRRNAPLMLSYVFRGQPRLVLRYDEYRHGLSERQGLFQPPKGIRMAEAGREAPAPSPGP